MLLAEKPARQKQRPQLAAHGEAAELGRICVEALAVVAGDTEQGIIMYRRAEAGGQLRMGDQPAQLQGGVGVAS